jgi:hypothetical protein
MLHPPRGFAVRQCWAASRCSTPWCTSTLLGVTATAEGQNAGIGLIRYCLGPSSNGRTADFGSVNGGSNPPGPIPPQRRSLSILDIDLQRLPRFGAGCSPMMPRHRPSPLGVQPICTSPWIRSKRAPVLEPSWPPRHRTPVAQPEAKNDTAGTSVPAVSYSLKPILREAMERVSP